MPSAGDEAFLEQGGFHAFATTFEDLHGLERFPGVGRQRLMRRVTLCGEGSWKTAALLGIMKVMSTGLRRRLAYGGLRLSLRER
ncbi:hypothetical protein ACNKHL_00400 [Shigella flexneri]